MWSVLQSGFENLDLAGEWSNSECRYTDSPSPRRTSRGRTRSRTPPRRDVGHSREEALNPGNNLYVTGLSTRVTEKDLEEHFSKEGKVQPLFFLFPVC
jgi:transformer-2 protein